MKILSRPNLLQRAAVAAAAGVVLPTILAAQAPQQQTRPEYRVTRFDESWSVVRTFTSKSGIDQLKYIPLSDSGAAYLSVGGQLRTRAEGVSDFQSAEAADRTDSFGLARAVLHADLRTGPFVRVFAEGKHAVVFDRDLPGGRRPLDQDEWELQNAFVDLSIPASASFSVTARLGRQELLLGSQRLVSPLDWSNTRRTFDGGRLMARVGPLAVDGFITEPVTIRTTQWNARDSQSTFWGGVVRAAAPSAAFGWEGYVLGLSQESVGLFKAAGRHERLTLGGRVTGAIAGSALRYDLEGAWQGGELAVQEISAWFVASDLTRTFARLPARPAVGIGFDYASGDSDPTDGSAGTFHQLYPLGHAYAGYMDHLGRQNLIEARAVVTASPTSSIQTRASVHHFMRASTEDASYNVGGGILKESWGDERGVGSELDLTATYRVNRHTRLEVGYGHFRPAAFLTGSPSGAVDSDWVFASTSFTF